LNELRCICVRNATQQGVVIPNQPLA
jgi:hypothetical protein